jgi:hypothetical protein
LETFSIVTRPTATGAVGGNPRNSCVAARKMPVAKQNAASQRSAEMIRFGSKRGECIGLSAED